MESKKLTNDVTTTAIQKAHKALEQIMSEVIMNPDFDVDMFISNICYWYEFQGLAKAFGKKLIYFKPRPQKVKEEE